MFDFILNAQSTIIVHDLYIKHHSVPHARNVCYRRWEGNGSLVCNWKYASESLTKEQLTPVRVLRTKLLSTHIEDVNRVEQCKRDVITSRVKAERRPSDLDLNHFHGNLTQNQACLLVESSVAKYHYFANARGQNKIEQNKREELTQQKHANQI